MDSEEKLKIVFVCTGNTCRSPMAEALFVSLLEKCRAANSFEVSSAGIAAITGAPAMQAAQEAVSEWGLNISSHRSRKCSVAELREAGLVVTMTGPQLEVLRPHLEEGRLLCLGAFADTDIADPFGSDLDTYRACRDQIMEALRKLYAFLSDRSEDKKL